MIGNGADALEHALELHARPGALAMLRQRPLPDAVLLLIRIAAGDRQAIQDAASRTSLGTGTLADVAAMYLRQVLFDADADNYRLLGVRADASEDTFKEHHRWLMRWLHPDRDPDRLGESDAQRVNRAWHVLRSSERRFAYDRQRAQEAASPIQRASAPSVYRHVPTSRIPPRPLLSPGVVRHLPVLVLGGLALLAGGSLASWHWLEQDAEANFATLRSHRLGAGTNVHSPVAQASVAPPSPRIAGAPVHASAADVPMAQVGLRHDATEHTAAAPPMRTANGHAEPHAQAEQTTPPGIDSVPATMPRTARLAATATAPGIAQGPVDDPVVDQAGADPAYAAVPDRFATAYAQGDLEQMMRLFASDAVDDHGGTATIANEYERLFRTTRSRRLRLGPFAWSTQDGRVVGTGAFDARLRRRGHVYARHLHGRILIEIAPIDDQWKIQRISLREGQR